MSPCPSACHVTFCFPAGAAGVVADRLIDINPLSQPRRILLVGITGVCLLYVLEFHELQSDGSGGCCTSKKCVPLTLACCLLQFRLRVFARFVVLRDIQLETS